MATVVMQNPMATPHVVISMPTPQPHALTKSAKPTTSFTLAIEDEHCTLLARVDPFTIPSATLQTEYTRSKRWWGTALVCVWLVVVAVYWAVLWEQDLTRPDALMPSTRAAASQPQRATFVPSDLMLPGGMLTTTFFPSGTDATAPCMQMQGWGNDINSTATILPLCPATAGRILGAPANDVAGAVVLLQLRLPCPPIPSVDDPAFFNGITLTDLLAAAGLPNTTRLGTLHYGASEVPLYARDVQTRVCRPPALAQQLAFLPSSRRIADTSRVPVVYAQLQLRETVHADGRIVRDVAATTLRAREDDAWDISGGDADAFSLPAAPAEQKIGTSYSAISQLKRRGLFSVVTATLVWNIGIEDAFASQLFCDSSSATPCLPVFGSTYPPSEANAVAVGNATTYWQANNTVRAMHAGMGWPPFATVTSTECTALDALGMTYTPMATPKQRSVVLVPTLNAIGDQNPNDVSYSYLFQQLAPGPESAQPQQRAANAAAGFGCGLAWRSVAPAERACYTQTAYEYTLVYRDAYTVRVASIEEKAVLACAHNALPHPLTDQTMPTTADDLGERVMDRVGRRWGTADHGSNVPTGNLCISGGACLFTTQPDVQTLAVVVAAAPTVQVNTYVSARQGGLAIFAQVSGIVGLAWTALGYCKRIALMAEGKCAAARKRRTKAVMTAEHA